MSAAIAFDEYSHGLPEVAARLLGHLWRMAQRNDGQVWPDIEWIQRKLRKSRSRCYAYLAQLKSAGWIERCKVKPPNLGRLVNGWRVRDVCAVPETGQIHLGAETEKSQEREPLPTLEEKREEKPKELESVTEAKSQTTLFELPPVAPTEAQHEERKAEIHRDERETATRVAAYERERYGDHPRCKRAKRSDPKSVRRSVDAIVEVLRSGVTELECKAAIELQWRKCEINPESWDRWTGVEFWRGQKLTVLLAWLEEPGNADCWRIASGELPRPTACPDPSEETGHPPEQAEPAAEWDASLGDMIQL